MTQSLENLEIYLNEALRTQNIEEFKLNVSDRAGSIFITPFDQPARSFPEQSYTVEGELPDANNYLLKIVESTVDAVQFKIQPTLPSADDWLTWQAFEVAGNHISPVDSNELAAIAQ